MVNRAGQFMGSNVQEVSRIALEELRRLRKDLAALNKRIGLARRTLASLGNLFGEHLFSEELLELMGRKNSGRQPGLTSACRGALQEAKEQLSAADVRDFLNKSYPGLLGRHKNPIASVTTVMHRLVSYGEAREVTKENRRAWESTRSPSADEKDLLES